MKAALLHIPSALVSTEDLEIEGRQEGEALLGVVAASVSHSDYQVIHGRRTLKEVMVYARFLASRQP